MRKIKIGNGKTFMPTNTQGVKLVLRSSTYGNTTQTLAHMSVSSVVIAWKGQMDRLCSGCYSDLGKHQSHCTSSHHPGQARMVGAVVGLVHICARTHTDWVHTLTDVLVTDTCTFIRLAYPSICNRFLHIT